ncbi:MAG: hypothetical protein AB7U75_10150 [Hyphomicrobiaceae bacterium]
MTNLREMIAPRSAATWKALARKDRLLFATAEDDIATFIAVSLQRAACGMNTAALVMGAGRCFEPGYVKYTLKRNTFRALRKIERLKLISILPFYLDARFSLVTSCWIYDPQFWDLAGMVACGRLPSTKLAEDMTAASAGRPVLLFLGSPSGIKGYPFLADLIEARPGIAKRMLIAIAGRVPPAHKERSARLSSHGVWFADRFLTENEVVSLKAAADTLWACYNPAYNSSSGIFGRSLQLDKNVIVRRASYLERIAQYVNYPVETCLHGDMEEGLALLERLASSKVQRSPSGLARTFYDASVPILCQALSIDGNSGNS